MTDLTENDARVFVDAVSNYFTHLNGQLAAIQSAYLAGKQLPRYDYTGKITLSGHFRGSVYFSASSMMAAKLLLAMRETDTCKSNLLDIVGEVANTIAGNARRHFGAELEISPPVTMYGPDLDTSGPLRERPFAIELSWQQSKGVVLVDLETLK